MTPSESTTVRDAEPTSEQLLDDRFGEALALAHTLHRGRTRKGTAIPYVSHLLAVSALVLEDGGDCDEAIAALLHDALEDQGDRIDADALERRFGRRVREIVVACTDTAAHHAGGEKEPWETRKQRYLEHLRLGGPSLRVSMADKLHNVRAILADHDRIGDGVFERFSAPRERTLWYYEALVRAYRAAGAEGGLFREFERSVARLIRRAMPEATADGPAMR